MTLQGMNFRTAAVKGISDDQFIQELRAERRLEEAIDQMRRAIADVNKTSTVVEIEPSAFEHFVSDECPDHAYWSERLSIARQS